MKLEKEQWTIILLALISSLFVFIYSSRLICLADWSLFTEYGYRFYLGQRPYIDFGLVLTPGTFIIQGFLIKIFGVNYYAQLGFVALEAATSMILTWMILKEITQEKFYLVYSLIPLVFLAPGVLGPYPDYDYDSCVIALLSLYFLTKGFKGNDGRLYFAAGFTAVLVFFFKQTIGAGVVAGMMTTSLLRPKKMCLALVGIFVGIACFALTIIMMSGLEGLTEAFRWIFIYARETRGQNAISLILNTFKLPVPYLYAASWLISYYFFKVKRNQIHVSTAFFFFALPFLPSSFFALSSRLDPIEKYFAYLWPGTFLMAGPLYTFNFIKNKMMTPGLLVFIICTVTSLATFASHGLIGGSNYGIWPLFFLIWVGILNDFFILKKFVLFFSLLLLIPAGTYLQSNMLNKSVIPWKLESQTASWPGLKGLTTPGPWIYNFEELLKWTEKNIPHSDRVISLPGEDPFYSLTGRSPQLSVFLIIRGGFPFDLEWLGKEIRKEKIQWVILKTNLQLPRVFLKTDHLMDNLKQEYSLVQTLKGYEVYKTNDYSK